MIRCYPFLLHGFVSFAALFMSFNGSAQQSFASLSAGYAFGIHGIQHPLFEESSISGNTITTQAKALALGGGYRYRGDIRFYFNDYIGIGLGGDIFRGKWNEFHSERKIVYVQTTSRRACVNGFTLMASLHVRTGEGMVQPYASVSPSFFMGKMTLIDTVRYEEQLKTATWEYTPLRKLHMTYAAGLDLYATEELLFFLECQVQHFSVSPDRATLLVRDGSDDLEDVPNSEKLTVFQDKISIDYTQVPDDNLPRKEIRTWFPLDNFQIRLGLRILLQD
ncbi:MAG TPA: hypothetical protein P5228_00435 [Bacteroidales bacterium]|nr:hypothetical protein [Bacteroidales bacterium]HRZ49522.1 hypothetical protein [Bacteroidales bacterium]